jgi:hypothetical protein
MAKYLDNPDDYFKSSRAEREGEQPVTLTATEARQGRWGRPVLYVLVCGIVLAMIAWWAAEYYGAEIAPNTDKTITSSVSKSPANNQPATNQKIINDNQPKGQPVQKSPAIQDSTKM